MSEPSRPIHADAVESFFGMLGEMPEDDRKDFLDRIRRITEEFDAEQEEVEE